MRSILLAAATLLAFPVAAQSIGEPQPTSIESSIPAARDVPYPGTMRLEIDATDLARRIFRVRQAIPVVAAGPTTLFLPQWLPGNHAPRGPISSIAGLRITADGRELPWRRDPVEVYGFTVDVPASARELVADFQHLSPTLPAQGRVTMTPEMLNLQWEKMSLYPAGYFVRRIPVQATVTYPAGWSAATALDVSSRQGSKLTYAPVSYETLVDSPVFAGRYFRKEVLAPGVNLNIFADQPEDLAATPQQLATHRALARQAERAFASRHFDDYEFLLALTDKLGDIGLEHLASSENAHPRDYFTGWNKTSSGRDLLPHELAHSWNGKYRRPADLFTPDYRQPMRNSLLWLYEGQTQFWGLVLSARSGIMPPEDVKAAIARVAAYHDQLPGRAWRPLVDTTNDPILAARAPKPWPTYQRAEDYYNEGMLIWLEADTLLRERTNGRRSLDNFAAAFFGRNPGQTGQLTYDRDEVVAVLNRLAPYDWAGFFRQRVDAVNATAPLEGLSRGGYRLAYSETAPAWFAGREKQREETDLSFGLGVTVGKNGELSAVVWDSPLFDQGLTAGAQLVAVNGRAYSDDGFKAAIGEAKRTRRPFQLLVKSGDQYRQLDVPYFDGLRYPVLERAGGPARLDQLLSPRK